MKPKQPDRFIRTARLWGPSLPLPRIPTVAFALLAGSCAFSGLLPAADTPPPAANAVIEVARVTNLKTLDDQYHLAMGDRVSYRVIEDKDEVKALVVTDSGELEVPYLGRVKAVDKTCKQLAQEVKLALEKDLYYQATVILAVDQLNKKRGSVYVVGQVRTAGAVDIPSDEILTLSKAILKAGGFADFADKKRVRITRQGGSGDSPKTPLVVDVSAIFEKGKTETDINLEPGDLIFVPSRAFNF
ncbi:MAG: hypothetical protein DME18_16755 [Verrucomicrobia bacterium]|nr:MAG: hypothetical protein DME18_16755 [Verrucomicrobiota bacterium]